MFFISTQGHLKTTLLICCLLATLAANAESEAKPTLADVIKTSIESGGPSAAQKQFNKIYPANKDHYNLDSQAMMQLVSEYANSGHMEAAQIVSEIFATITQDTMQQQMAKHEPELKQLMAQQKALKQSAKASTSKPNEEATDLTEIESQPRADLERFSGLYGDPNKPDPYRQFWVTQSCDGKLVIGATWGDASPWWMTSTADTLFSYHDAFTHLRMEFTTNDQGQAIELKHDLKGMVSPLERVGPLTEEYEKCIEPFRR